MRIRTVLAVLAVLALTVPAMGGSRPIGIDVSNNQPSITWSGTNGVNTDPKGISFAFVRASLGSGVFSGHGYHNRRDPDFDYNMQNGSIGGLLMAPYHLAAPDTTNGTLTDDAQAEALYFLSVAGPYIKTGFLPPVLDIERSSNDTTTFTQAQISLWVNVWCNTVFNATGVRPIVYTNQNFASNFLDSTVSQWQVWMANWNGQDPQTGSPGTTTPWSGWNFWQYYSPDQTDPPNVIPNVVGISSPVDLDVFNGCASDLAALVIKHTTPPTVGAFTATPAAVAIGDPFTISYSVSDTGGSHLNHLEIWRYRGVQPPAGKWPAGSHIADIPLSGDTAADTLSNPVYAPPYVGTWWYGIHVVNNNSSYNWNDEHNSQTSGAPVFGPIKVIAGAYGYGYIGTTPATPGGQVNLSAGGPYTSCQAITVTAVAQPGYSFCGWNVDCACVLSDSTAISTMLTINDNFTLMAYFAPIGTPTVCALGVTPSSLAVGGSVTISYTVSESGGSGLNRITLWRAPDAGGIPGVWQQVGSPINLATVGNGQAQGSFLDAPPAGGTWWYGVHVIDNAGNWNDEHNSRTTGTPVCGPLPVAVTSFVTSSAGTVWAWGDNAYDELGDNMTMSTGVRPRGMPTPSSSRPTARSGLGGMIPMASSGMALS